MVKTNYNQSLVKCVSDFRNRWENKQFELILFVLSQILVILAWEPWWEHSSTISTQKVLKREIYYTAMYQIISYRLAKEVSCSQFLLYFSRNQNHGKYL